MLIYEILLDEGTEHGVGVEVYLWRPDDFGRIAEILRGVV